MMVQYCDVYLLPLKQPRLCGQALLREAEWYVERAKAEDGGN